MARAERRPSALTIAGSDSGGGAGVAADLRVFSRLGVHGALAITAVTAQNTEGVRRVHPIPAEDVAAQIDAVLEDLDVRAVKTGMLARAEIVLAIAERMGGRALVVDPVLISSSGTPLLDDSGRAALVARLLPLAAVVTPNVPEAEALLGRAIRSLEEMTLAGRALLALGPGAALMKGGHLPVKGEVVDLLVTRDGVFSFSGARVDAGPTHGTGCALSAAVAAGLALGKPLPAAAGDACALVRAALSRAAARGPVGSGRLPLDLDP